MSLRDTIVVDEENRLHRGRSSKRRATPPMARSSKLQKQVSDGEEMPAEQYVRVRLKALEIPPVKDGIVIGKRAPIGAEAMLRTLKLMSNECFVHLPIKGDDIMSDAIVRESVLRKLKREKLYQFITKRIRPLMADNELLMLDMEIEVVVEDTL